MIMKRSGLALPTSFIVCAALYGRSVAGREGGLLAILCSIPHASSNYPHHSAVDHCRSARPRRQTVSYNYYASFERPLDRVAETTKASQGVVEDTWYALDVSILVPGANEVGPHPHLPLITPMILYKVSYNYPTSVHYFITLNLGR
ncbi:hypothetical protein LXA43DRAFT_1066814 [Ganoderma leucocontextum]|nr:hypothetical protein LXA43DRAFT_1066814 [Ganoderma leucocontextum]